MSLKTADLCSLCVASEILLGLLKCLNRTSPLHEPLHWKAKRDPKANMLSLMLYLQSFLRKNVSMGYVGLNENLKDSKDLKLQCRTSPTRNRAPLGPYSRTTPRGLWCPWGGGRFLMSEVTLYEPFIKSQFSSRNQP